MTLRPIAHPCEHGRSLATSRCIRPCRALAVHPPHGRMHARTHALAVPRCVRRTAAQWKIVRGRFCAECILREGVRQRRLAHPLMRSHACAARSILAQPSAAPNRTWRMRQSAKASSFRQSAGCECCAVPCCMPLRVSIIAAALARRRGFRPVSSESRNHYCSGGK